MKSLREVLSGRPVVGLEGSATVFEAAQAMAKNKVGALLVIDSEGKPRGIFTERDLMTRVVVPELDVHKARLEQHMTADMYYASPDRRASDVAQEMQTRHIRHLPVIENGQCLGMLSLRDLLREHLAVKKHEVDALTAYIQGDTDAEE